VSDDNSFFLSWCFILFLDFRLRDETYEHRRRAYGATTFLQQYKEFFDGLSFAINRTSHDIKAIRALVIVSEFFGT